MALYRSLSLSSNDEGVSRLLSVDKTCPPGLLTPQTSTLDAVEETPSEYRRRWFSLAVALSIAFMMSAQNSIFWNSLWPFLQTIDDSATESFFGYIIMAFSLTSAIASPIFGVWSNRICQTRLPIIVGIIFTIGGNALYAFVEAFPDNRRWILFGARLITGVGAGNSGALFAYIVMGSKESERNMAISIRAAVGSVSIMFGPGMQSAFVPIGYPGYVRGPFHMDMYTAPAYLCILLGIVQILLMIFAFEERWVSVAKTEMEKTENRKTNDGEIGAYDHVAIFVCMWVRFCLVFCLVYDDVIGSPLTMVMFKWTPEQAVLYNGLITVGVGVVDFFGSLLVGNVLLKFLKERVCIIIGLIGYLLFFFVVFPWPGLPPLVGEEDTDGAAASSGVFNLSTDATTAAKSTYSTESASAPPGECTYSWCTYTTRINLAQYLVAQLFVLVAVSIGFTTNSTLFSKLLGPRKQGTIQGLFQGLGQLANTISPLVCSNLFQFNGPRVMWGVGAAIVVTSVIPVLATYNRLIPWSERHSDERKPLLDDQGCRRNKTAENVEARTCSTRDQASL